MVRRHRDAWVFLRGCTDTSAVGATVELVEARRTRRAGPDGGAGGRYAWARFPQTADGVYTVRVTYPSGQRQTARLVVSDAAQAITLDEAAAVDPDA